MPEELETTWDLVRRELRRETTDFTFHVWLDPLGLAGRRGNTLYVRAPGHIRSWVRDRYLAPLRAAATGALGAPAAVEIVGEDWVEPPPVPGGPADAPGAEDGGALNPKYTFEQFVIGRGNRLAHAAGLAVAELPGQAYNPLFVHGPPGLGKTHLLHAIGNYVRTYGQGLRVRYAPVEAFTNDFVQALRAGDTAAFKRRFRAVDLLLVDDIQFLADKPRTKEEFFHTFNALYEAGAQLVLASDRAPGEMGDIEARLCQRFECGLVADLQPPDFEVRLAILKNRARLDGVGEVGDETLAEIADTVEGSVRRIEGALIRVVAYASLRAEPATPELARRVLDRLYRPRGGAERTLEEIQGATAAAFGLAREDLLARDRRPEVARARHVAMYLARELTETGLPALGRGFGGRSHSTVLHAHRKIAEEMGADRDTVAVVERLTAELTGARGGRSRCEN